MLAKERSFRCRLETQNSCYKPGESQHATDNYCRRTVEAVIADCTPGVVVEDLETSLARPVSIYQTNTGG
ncbi:hypothetical protein DPMN_099331 [Dreissena polymorpha]|uniref:Uncharacterized protein n=1 Tax=Dreissena polymorpha TaxID=45954 RepID=A0A9D4R754_DREPO|nr:hypothetical protein DPMN_099331 [Dreissena polymorpha]